MNQLFAQGYDASEYVGKMDTSVFSNRSLTIFETLCSNDDEPFFSFSRGLNGFFNLFLLQLKSTIFYFWKFPFSRKWHWDLPLLFFRLRRANFDLPKNISKHFRLRRLPQNTFIFFACGAQSSTYLPRISIYFLGFVWTVNWKSQNSQKANWNFH